jgi:hypothetical protein
MGMCRAVALDFATTSPPRKRATLTADALKDLR